MWFWLIPGNMPQGYKSRRFYKERYATEHHHYVVMLMGAGATKFKELEIYYKVLSKVLSGRKAICDSPFSIWLRAITDVLISKYYRDWVDKRYGFWSKEHWNPAREAFFSRLSISYSAGDASNKGTTEQKRGFSLFSRKKKAPASQSSKTVLLVPPKDSSSSALSSPPMTTLNSSRSRMSSSPMAADVGDSANSDLSDLDDSASVVSTLMPPVPTVLETLSSAYLRRLITTHYLGNHLLDDEKAIWKTLCAYFDKYQPLSDADIESSQDEMRAAALDILDKYESFMMKGYFLRSHIQKKGLITPYFFRDEEVNLLRMYYAGYEISLRQKGWTAPEK